METCTETKVKQVEVVFQAVQSILTQSCLPFRLHHHEPVVTVAQAQTVVPHLTENLIKTVVFKIKDGPWILAAVGGDDRIHYKYLADVYGVNRKLIRSVSALDVEAGLGFEIGGVGPFPVAPDVRVIMDKGLMELPHVFCGSGRNTVTVEMGPQDLATASNADVAAIIKL